MAVRANTADAVCRSVLDRTFGFAAPAPPDGSAIIFNASEQTADSPNENRAGRSSRADAALARLDGRALDGEEPLEINHGEQVLLNRAPVGLRGDLRAKAVGEVRVDLLPRRVGCEQGRRRIGDDPVARSEEHTSELQSRLHLVCRLLLEKKKKKKKKTVMEYHMITSP